MTVPPVATETDWRAALAGVRELEKALTRQKDAVSAARRRLPMYPIEKDYSFTGPGGKVGLLDLFDGRQQLIVYHFMFGSDWKAGCPGCSWVTDAMTHPAHLHARDTSLVLVSRAPLEALTAYKQRMGWSLPWLSSEGSEFNVDMGATVNDEEDHGVSVFFRDGEQIYRTYHTGDRGVEHLGSHWTYLDLTPYGRRETWEDSPEGWPQVPTYTQDRRHDEY